MTLHSKSPIAILLEGERHRNVFVLNFVTSGTSRFEVSSISLHAVPSWSKPHRPPAPVLNLRLVKDALFPVGVHFFLFGMDRKAQILQILS